MKLTLLVIPCLALAALPTLTQTGAGTPPISNSSALDKPIPLKLLLPHSDGSGTLLVRAKNPQPGRAVPITFVVTNTSKKPVVYNFPTGQKFDITVNDSKGTLVWTWSQGKVFTQNISRLSIPPGKRASFPAVWNGRDSMGHPVPPGDYTINARTTSRTGTAITGSFVINNDPDPTNIGRPTRTPADSGAARQVDVTPPVTASQTITIGTPPAPAK